MWNPKFDAAILVDPQGNEVGRVAEGMDESDDMIDDDELEAEELPINSGEVCLFLPFQLDLFIIANYLVNRTTLGSVYRNVIRLHVKVHLNALKRRRLAEN